MSDTTALATYDAFAPFYDEFTAHHDYLAWCADIERLALAAGLRGRRLLDIACGTGKSFLPFLARGYAVTACDVSSAMLALARAKVPADVRIERHDMRELPRLGEFDLVCILDDAVNYLRSREELATALGRAAANLAPDGVLVFDANTLLAYRSFFAQPALVRNGDRVLVWDGRTAPDMPASGVSDAELLAFAPDGDGAWRLTRSVHRQRHHPRETVLAALDAAGLGWFAVYGMRPDGAIAPGFAELAISKALYVARHCAPETHDRAHHGAPEDAERR
jgi:SAM-dependent methyltransferase